MAAASQIKCPHCGQSYLVQPEQWSQYLGQAINCTRCGREFQVAAAPVANVPSPSLPTAATAPAYPQPAYPQPRIGPTSPFEQPPTYPGAPVPSSGWALTSFIFGIAGFCVPGIGAIIAIASGILGIVRTKEGRATGRGVAIAGLVLGSINLFLTPFWIIGGIGAVNEIRAEANAKVCSKHLRAVSGLILQYAADHDSKLPDQLSDLADAATLPDPMIFICPDDSRTPPSGASAQQMKADLSSGAHSSFNYVGDGLVPKSSATMLVCYEAFELEHDGKIFVAYADGHVTQVPTLAVKQALANRRHHEPIDLNDVGTDEP
jgi:prepilin-type processing-associated H-X9-DG protein